MVFGIQNVRCTIAAEERLQQLGACYEKEYFSMEAALWKYFQCKHPKEDYLGSQMHSYVYIGQKFVGNGFALLADAHDSRLGPHPCLDDKHLSADVTAAGGTLTCKQDCESKVSATKLAELKNAI